jgi:hypothetical protein
MKVEISMHDRRKFGRLDRPWLPGLLLLCLVTALTGCGTPGLVGITISPTTELFAGAGGTAQFTAIGTYGQVDHPDRTEDITDIVTWKSNAVGVATINTSGLTTSTGLGSTIITASMQGFNGLITGTATVTVCQYIDPATGACATPPAN